MRDKIYAYLKSREGGATSHELVECVLNIKGASAKISETLIQTAVAGDRRFAIDEHRLWKIVERGGIPISETEVVFLSILTLDTIELPKAIVEVSAQKLRNDMIVDRFHAFINPASSIAPNIRLPADFVQEIQGGIPAETAACALFDFFGDAVLVGYDTQPSVHQLNKVLNNVNKTIENLSLCLQYLTKKLLPNLHSKSLNDVAAFFKLPIMDTRRTEEEVGAIADIFSRYKELLKEQGLDTLEEIVEFQYPNIEYVDFSNYAFDKGFLWAIPQKPGVYKMKDKLGGIIYVGKAKNLRARVSSYFWNTADRLQKITDLLRTVHSIEYEVTGSELSALLMEYRLIKQYQPGLNQQLEVHERTARYGRLKNFIVILPSSREDGLELFFVKDGLPIERYEILRDAVNFSGVEEILGKMYYGIAGATSRSFSHPKVDAELLTHSTHSTKREETKGLAISTSMDVGKDVIGKKVFSDKNIQGDTTLTNVETGEIDIVLSWLDTNRDQVNYINMDIVCTKEACLKLVRDYIRDEETPQKKHFRLK